MMTSEEAARRALRGAQLLTEKRRSGKWVFEVDLGLLDMGSLSNCVLGQLYASVAKGRTDVASGFGAGSKELFRDELDGAAASDYGFDVLASAVSTAEYRQLTAVWRELIERLRDESAARA